MAARSEHGYYVRGLASRIAADRFADAATLRDGLVNNPNHLADQRGQVVAQVTGSWVTDDADDISAGWHQFYAFPKIRVLLTRLSSGDSAAIVPRIYAKVNSGSATIRVGLIPVRGTRLPLATGDSVSEVTVTSTTGEYLEPDPIFVPATDIGDLGASSPWRGSSYPEYPSTSGAGAAVRMRVLVALLGVWVQSATTPTLMGVSAREYIGG